ncbi:MAG: response regulator [Deltaproteobacteria bacterium]|nr:response regulator [Deltaproteobacteria bacterium]
MVNNLNDYVGWVASMEAKAANIYRKLALTATDDEDMVAFARKLSEEEEWHYRAIRSVDKEIINIVARKENSSLIDNKAIRRIESALEELEEVVDSGDLSIEDLLESILSLELSELNTVFIEVVDLFTEYKVELQALRSHVRRHQNSIEAFAGKRGIAKKKEPKRGEDMDPAGNSILIIEDESAIRDILVLALKKFGTVETAPNGMEALCMVKKKHYDLIFSDIDMPVMTGIEFYNSFISADPYLNRRILFFSGAIGSDERDFINKNNMKCLEKPSTLAEIRERALNILEREPEK